jgi:hypothetical protein
VQNTNKLWLGVILTCIAAGAANESVAPAPLFVSDNPQSIYAADPNDSWNRIFRALFTRTVKARVSDAFPEGAPFNSFHVRMGSFSIRLSKETLSRTELGDRAIEPLYPTFFTTSGPLQVFSEPLFTELTAALREAIDAKKTRSPIERALMQADVWAAYDILYSVRHAVSPERSTKLLGLLRQFLRKLALSSDEIKSLKNNYALAVSGSKLPDLFSTGSGWLEIELLPQRHHDDVASYRRAARVLVKPRTPPANAGQFVESLKRNQHHDQVEAVALVVQNLLIDTSGRVVPSPLFSDVQFRFFKNDPKTGATSAEPQQFELSRRKLLTEPVSGGFVEFAATYLSAAGNDYDFATPIEDAEAPILVPLRSRCAQCHNRTLTTMMTYSIHGFPPVPTVRILKSSDQERAFHVARRKEERDDFKSLFRGQ